MSVAKLQFYAANSRCALITLGVIAQRYQLSFYDACIVAVAAAAKCRVLCSEDMNHGQIFEDGLMIKNSFTHDRSQWTHNKSSK